MSKYKIRYKEVGRSRIGETTYSGPLSEDEVIAFFGLDGLRIFWMSPYRKIWYDKYSNVFNIFHLHIGCELLRRAVPLEIVYEPKDEPKNG